jgi:uncharacterized protein YndB with AHSA1/START domain
VWQALTDSAQFGAWFGVRFEEPFVAGKKINGKLVGTQVDPEVAKAQSAYKDMAFTITIDRIEPQTLFSFRWHPHAIDGKKDYSLEPTTLVEFTLHDDKDGVRLMVAESGFDKVPLDRRAQAFSANSRGWEIQLTLIEKYLLNAHAVDR